MIFRQFFEPVSSTYTYLVASKGEALLIDPVLEDSAKYLEAIRELGLRLVIALDTHIHADHVTALGSLQDATKCRTLIGEQAQADCVSAKVREGEQLKVGDLAMRVLYTPGHTDDSYSFLLPDRVFTGDTLLIRSTGRTDFQNGDPAAQYDSIFGKLLRLPESTILYPAHDYKGDTASTIGDERRLNPRLQVDSKEAYVAQMRALKLAPPKLMDIAVPANRQCGRR